MIYLFSGILVESQKKLGIFAPPLEGAIASLSVPKTWLSWNGKRVLSESCKHCKRLTTKTQSINKAFSSSFAGALRAPAQRFELGLRWERLSRGRAQRIVSSIEKSSENGLKMVPRRLQNRSQVASKWLPEASRSPPKTGNANGNLFCSFLWPLGRLLGCSWGASGGSWGRLAVSYTHLTLPTNREV